MDMVVKFFDLVQRFFEHHIVFSTGGLLFLGYFFGKLAEKVRLPAITGYIVAGLVMSDSVSGIVHTAVAERLTSITEIALGLIAITIGAEFELSRIRQVGKGVLLMTLFEGLFAFIFVTIAFRLIGFSLTYALTLGAIAPATAPAATVVIIRELKTRGRFVDTLYGIVALDDALCVLIFSLVFAVVGPLLAGQATPGMVGLLDGFLLAFKEIGLSILLGAVCGYLLFLLTRRRFKLNEILIIAVGIIFLATSLAIMLGLSHLIVNMMLGAVLINTSTRNKRVFKVLEPLTPPIFALFFILAGTELEIGVFAKGIVVLYGLLYIVSRFSGKYLGIYSVARATKATANIRRFLGLCLFPQAGVAIGLVLFMQTSPLLSEAAPAVREMLVLIVNVILFSIFINELVGPTISRLGITKGTRY